MNRHYTAEQYAEKVALIRRHFPEAALTTDVIVGFPTETEQAFENSRAFCRDTVKFADIHVFPYSSRKGTAAGKMRVLPPETVAARQQSMSEVKRELSADFRLKQLGKPVEVLFESKEDGMWCGHTPNYVKVYSSVGGHNTLSVVTPTALYGDGVRV